jgi:hypothetical protein
MTLPTLQEEHQHNLLGGSSSVVVDGRVGASAARLVGYRVIRSEGFVALIGIKRTDSFEDRENIARRGHFKI